ncbi:MAG: methyltransferase domain-containing protein, partial [Lachnospiraceae bacterium]
DQIVKSEENILKTFDGRIWKSEENVLRTFDGRIWKCEQKTVKAINERIWNMSYKMEKHFPQHSLTRQSNDYVYNEFFYDENRYNSYMSAYHVFKKLLPILKPKSICDFGCGTGTWLYVAQKFGVEKVTGLDGNYVDRDLLMIDVDDFIPSDLRQPTLLNQSFDLAISLEVAEHIDAKYADIFIDNICSSSKVIIFSAAHPGQGGDEHVNEQPFSYWKHKFEVRGYTYIEIRSLFELNQDICTWYRENIALFVKKDIAEQYNLKFTQLVGDIT